MNAVQERTKGKQAAENKVGVYDDTKKLLDSLSDETGITRVRIIQDALKNYARSIRGRKHPARDAA